MLNAFCTKNKRSESIILLYELITDRKTNDFQVYGHYFITFNFFFSFLFCFDRNQNEIVAHSSCIYFYV